MINLDHERVRLYKLVDDFLENLARDNDDGSIDDIRIEHAGLIAICIGTDEEGDTVESPVMSFETQRPYVQMGIVQTAMLRLMHR